MAAAQSELLALKSAGVISLFASYPRRLPSGRQVTLMDLQSVGIRSPEQLVQEADALLPAVGIALFLSLAAAGASILLRSSAAGFWVTTVLLLAAFGALWVGAFSPQLLPGALLDPEEQQRATAHEAAHFLVGHLLGVPIRSYSVDTQGRPAVEFDDRTGPLASTATSRPSLDAFCVVACAGIAGEGMLWEGSRGGAADLRALGLAISNGRAGAELGPIAEQLNFTRWGVFYAASMLSAHRASWDALRRAMDEGADLCECIRVVESAGAASTLGSFQR